MLSIMHFLGLRSANQATGSRNTLGFRK